mgnify:CR=1 FL=1
MTTDAIKAKAKDKYEQARQKSAPAVRFLNKYFGWLRYAAPSRYINILDWYIIKKFIGTYIFSILLIISISVVFDINENLAKFTEYHAPLKAIVFDYYLNFIPYFANLFSPLFVFIAVIFFTSKLAGNSEIIAMLGLLRYRYDPTAQRQGPRRRAQLLR